MSTVLITGNTYPVKEKIKALGGRWNADAKGWAVPADKADEAKALVASAPVRNGKGRAHRSNRVEEGYYRGRGGEVMASGCSACRALGHMCRECLHDYE